MSIFSQIIHPPLRTIQSITERLETGFMAAIKPRSDKQVVGTALDLTRSKSELVAENALLRQQLIVVKRQNVLS